MKRIDTINSRENMFGVGKSGFHDNADLPGQDATYVSPEWFNTVQEELCNLLELRGITLDPASKRQLYDLLTTQTDLEALADEIETNFIRKSQIVDNLTTNDATKVASAKQVKILQDNKLDKTALNNTLTSTSTTQALTAAQGNALKDLLFGEGQTPKNVTSSRPLNTLLTNTTGRTIFISLFCASSGNTLPEAKMTVSGILVARSLSRFYEYEKVAYVCWPVPNGVTYKLECSGHTTYTVAELS